MAETQSRPRLIRFGAFEADIQTGELRKDGVKLKFSGQPFHVLAILLERPGDVVTREEFQKRLWPDTFVDVERNLNTAVNKIREVLGDSAESPSFVETLPRRGYRFIAQIEAPEPAVAPGKQVAEPASKKLWWKLATGMLAFGVLAVGSDLVLRRVPPHPNEPGVLHVAPFTALPGAEVSPSFSPDGSRIAFAWNSDTVHGQSGFDLYLKAIGSETLLRLTQHPSKWISAAWSPDGSHVAFHRIAGKDTGVYLVPALGGPERKLRSTRISSGWATFSMISWSPDGKWIAYSDLVPSQDRARIFLLSTETGESKRIPFVPKCLEEGGPAFSPNGDSLAYWCIQGYGESGLYSLLLTGGEPQLISFMRGFPNGLTWSASGKELIYSATSGEESEIWESTLSDGSVKRLAIPNDANDAAQPTVSAQGDKLAYSSFSSNVGVLCRDLFHPDAPPLGISPASRAQYSAQFSPDGKRIAFASRRSGEQGVWISDFDGGNLVQLSNPSDMSGSPQWSPDGTKIAFDSRRLDHWGIYLSSADERIPRKLVTNISDIYRPHWSRDERWLYFTSSTVGKAGAYRCLASGGDAVALTRDVDSVNAQESFDGGTVYFVSSRPAKKVLMRLHVGAPPGSESEVDGLPPLYDIDDWALTSGGIYFIPAEAPRSLRYYDFATKQTRFLFEMERDLDEGLSVSADGRWILYSSQIGDYNSDIMLVDHFH